MLNLLRAMRLERTLPILMIILIPAAYSDVFPLTILVLALVIVLIYSASSIYNAYKDKDYKLPDYSKKVVVALILSALIISAFVKIIFFIALFAVFLGFLYNTIARILPLGDALIAGMTHFALPVLTSSLLVGIELIKTVQFTVLVYFLALCIGPITNLKDVIKDRSLGYHTLVSDFKKPKIIAVIFLNFSLIVLFFLFLSLGIRGIFLVFLVPIFLLALIISRLIFLNYEKSALYLVRFYLILSYLFLILILSSNFYIILFSLSILIISLIILGWRLSNGKI